ncbi:branched-chain amino acid ABC transporter permease [Dactylosporangium sp. NPDC005572]|uniref:branched-chain amino acid ABC transporter permease n=1 Tax=Dactylosporangium sp. NPDC005572 TaxID=3156889 RepID=UPI0033BB8778
MTVAVVGLGLYGSTYLLSLGSKIAIYAIVILGLTLLVGYGGQISFGHNAFFGIGGYISALATTSWGLSPLPGMLVAALIAAALAVVTGYPTLRLRGHFLALGTFAVGLGFYAFAVASPYFNGFTGIGGIPPYSLGGLSFQREFAQFWVCGVFMLVALVAVAHLRGGRWGRALRTVSTDEATAQSVGIDVHRVKLTAFVVSALLASVAGSLYAHTTSYVSPETFSFATILTLFMMLFIGGAGSVWGAVLGSFVVTVVPELAPESMASWQPTFFGALLVIVLILRPAGLLGGRRRAARRPKDGGGQLRDRGSIGLRAHGAEASA